MFRIETQHALRAMTALAQHQGQMVLAELAVRSRVPAPMLAKVLNRLTQHRLVRGRPGPGGGYQLARPAEEIRLREIISLVEGPRFGLSCLFGLAECSDQSPCPLHEPWGTIRRRLLEMIDSHSVADLAQGRVTLQSEPPRP